MAWPVLVTSITITILHIALIAVHCTGLASPYVAWPLWLECRGAAAISAYALPPPPPPPPPPQRPSSLTREYHCQCCTYCKLQDDDDWRCMEFMMNMMIHLKAVKTTCSENGNEADLHIWLCCLIWKVCTAWSNSVLSSAACMKLKLYKAGQNRSMMIVVTAPGRLRLDVPAIAGPD